MHVNKLKQIDGRWYVYDSTGTKNVGKKEGYADKADADKQLRAIEASKHARGANQKVLLQTNLEKSMINETSDKFVIKGIPVTVNNAVMNRVLYPPEENEAGMNSMRGKPLTIGHPVDDNGNFVSGREGAALQNHFSGGVITNTYERHGTWYADADIKKSILKEQSNELYGKLKNRENMPVSTGLLFTPNDINGTNAKGDEYDMVAQNQSYDHLAALLNERPAGGDDTVARFNSENLCIINVNEYIEQEPVNDEAGLVKRIYNGVLQLLRNESYNTDDTNINVNEGEIMKVEELIEAARSNPDFAQALLGNAEMKKGMKTIVQDIEDDEEDKEKDKAKAKNSFSEERLQEIVATAVNAAVEPLKKQIQANEAGEIKNLREMAVNKGLAESVVNKMDKAELVDYVGEVNVNSFSGRPNVDGDLLCNELPD